MANTEYLKRVVEPYIVHWVSRNICITLKPEPIVVGKNSDGDDVPFTFDGVSADHTVGVLVSTSHTIKTGGYRKLYMDASLLNRAGFRRKIMAFVSRDVWQNFKNRCDGLVDLAGIQPMFCEELTEEMRIQIATIQKDSKRVVGDKGKVWTVGKPRRTAG